MQVVRGEGFSSKQRRGDLRPLAPRDSRPSSGRGRMSSSSTGRPPRLSHRSRAGCWTCRGRKVKCDETHPRCGPCTRLNRECDWDHRWNFNDSTNSTQGKYANVNTSGNAVWDPAVRYRYSTSPTTGEHELLADFASLTTDEEREKKAGTYKPGTFGVVVTPESFHELPEYAPASQSGPGSRRTSAASTASSRGNKSPSRQVFRRSFMIPDPNVVVLERFEDSSPMLSPSGLPRDQNTLGAYSHDRERLATPAPTFPPRIKDESIPTPAYRPDESLLTHFRRYIVPRLVQPQQTLSPDTISQGSTRDILELEACRFKPLHHAICAVSALSLAYNGQSSLEEAMQHYHQALAASTTAGAAQDLLSDGVFFRHFLLLIYDICIPMQSDSGGTDMWAEHLSHLLRIAVQRRMNNDGREPIAYTLWTICELDMYACLMGSGDCHFVKMISDSNMLPALDQQVPCVTTVQDPLNGALLLHEINVFPSILRLNQGIVLLGARVARTAHTFRSSASYSPGTMARWHATASALQNEIVGFWQHNYPAQLGLECPEAARNLPDRIRTVFEHALALYHAIMIYARTSMFPSQRTIPFAGQSEVVADTERRISAIVQIAEAEMERTLYERRHIVFPLFMAGFATFSDRIKGKVLEVIGFFVGSGIGQNTWRCRQLLATVIEEQRRLALEGGRMENVDWIRIGKERGLGVVNCGL